MMFGAVVIVGTVVVVVVGIYHVLVADIVCVV